MTQYWLFQMQESINIWAQENDMIKVINSSVKTYEGRIIQSVQVKNSSSYLIVDFIG